MLPLVPLIGLVRMPCTCSPCSPTAADDPLEGPGAVPGVGHHALPVEPTPADLELRLHEHDEVGLRHAGDRRGRPCTRVSEMNDRSATTRSAGPPRSSAVRPRTVVPLRSSTRGSCGHLGHELAVADVDRDDSGQRRGPAAPA